MRLRKAVFTVRVDNYLPDLCALTLPAMKRYADKIGADFYVIEERKFPELPPTYEKMQIWHLGANYDWSILIDCDMAIRDEMYDVTEVVLPDTVGSWMVYDPQITIAKDEYIPLDGTGTAVATNLVVVPWPLHGVWKPLEMSSTEILSRMKRQFVVDEYCFSRNMTERGIRLSSLALPGAEGNLFKHCNMTTDSKDPLIAIREVQEFLA
jgi:hypothetical protein